MMSRDWVGAGFRGAILILSLMAAFAAGRLVANHYATDFTCPMLGPVPACLIVFIAYLSIALSQLSPVRFRLRLFFLGWTPVFILAAMGSLLELWRGDVCPHTDSGAPQCYYSLIFSVILFALNIGAARARRRG